MIIFPSISIIQLVEIEFEVEKVEKKLNCQEFKDFRKKGFFFKI